MTKIFLIRHGESQQNSDDVLSGRQDIPLSEEGKRQCQVLAKYFASIPIDLVIATPLQRSIDTASLIFPGAEKKIEISDALIEIDYGSYDGLQRAAYENTEDTIIQQWLSSPANLTFPGGDNVTAHAEKVMKALNFIASKNDGKTIVCVSHRTTIRLILAQIIGLSLENFRSLPCSNCGISELEFLASKWRLNALNVTTEYLFRG